MNKTITVVIATYKRPDSLEKCLGALSRQTDKGFDVLIISGEESVSPSNKIEKVIRKFRKEIRIKTIIDPTPHLSYIRDSAWRRAEGDIIASIDDDALADRGWIEHIRSAFNKTKNLGGVTGPTVIPKKMLAKRDVFFFHTTKSRFWKLVARVYFALFMQGERYAIGKIYPSGAWSPGSNFQMSRTLKKPIAVDYLEACNYAIPKKILAEIGGYDTGYTKTSEWAEVDVAFRIRKKGYRLLFDPDVSVEHRVSQSGVYERRIFAWHRIRNFIRFYHNSYYPKTLQGYTLFMMHLIFITCYYGFKQIRFSR